MNLRVLFHCLITLFFCHNIGFSAESDSLKIIQKKNKEFLKKSPYALIPGGTASAPVIESSPIPVGSLMSQVFTVNDFFIAKAEVSNLDYLEFLAYYKTHDPEIHKTILPDTLVWRIPMAFNEPYVEYYLRHPAYQNYPVVGVSYEQANLYCAWLTELYNQNPARIYEKVVYRLPTELEWIYAAMGGNARAIYPWDGTSIRTEKGEIKANSLNFGTESVYRDTLYEKQYNGEFKEVYIYRAAPNFYGVASSLSDGSDVTAPVKSYWPNGFGLYNMAGNVSEMVAEEGITHGGSWQDPGAYLQICAQQFYTATNSASSSRGFRVVMEVLAY